MNTLANLPRILLDRQQRLFCQTPRRSPPAAVGSKSFHARKPPTRLTMLEWNAPAAIFCATNLREMGALEMAPILRADPKHRAHPAHRCRRRRRGEQALLEAYRAGCDDFVDRRRAPSDIAAHVRSFLVSRQDGFQPTQMLTSAETALERQSLSISICPA